MALPVSNAAGIHTVLYGEAAFAGLVFLLCVLDHVFFPALPPSAPSVTASIHHAVDTVKDFKALLRNPNLLCLCLAYGVSLGTYSGWSGVLDPILKPLHYSQTTASWCVCVRVCAQLACVLGPPRSGGLCGVCRCFVAAVRFVRELCACRVVGAGSVLRPPSGASSGVWRLASWGTLCQG